MNSVIITITTPDNWLKGIGLGDAESSDFNYTSRNAKTALPEVTKMGNGDATPLIEAWERTWYLAFRLRNPSLTEEFMLNQWRVMTKGDRAFTNKFGSDTKRSYVLNTNINSEPMRAEGVDCPGTNIFRLTSLNTKTINSRPCYPIWVLDYDYPPEIDQDYTSIKDFVKYLPSWTLHTARIVHPPTSSYPKGYSTDFDYSFPIPLMTKVGRQSIIDIDTPEGIKKYHVRENYMRESRIKLI
jgi:hypothetical protein